MDSMGFHGASMDSQMKNYSLKKFKVEMKDKLLSSLLW